MPVETLIDENMIIQSACFLCRTDGCEGRSVYGFRVLYSEETIYEADDISTSEIDVLRLIALIKDQGISIDQLPYIIEDYIGSL